MSYRDDDFEAKWQKTKSLKDAFMMAGQVRPATAEHYQAWLESHLDNGGKVDSYGGGFRADDFYTITQDATLPPELYGSASIKLIVPEGVVLTAPNIGHCDIFYIDGGKRAGHGKATVYKQNIPSMLERGYALPDLVQPAAWKDIVDDAVAMAPLGKGTVAEGLKSTYKMNVQQLDKLIGDIQNADFEGAVRKSLGIPSSTALDPAYAQVIEDARTKIQDDLRVQRYKADPSSNTPMPSLLKPKKGMAAPAAAPAVQTDDAIQIRKPLTLKSAVGAVAAKQESPAPAAPYQAGDGSTGIPAETPQKADKPFWQRIFG